MVQDGIRLTRLRRLNYLRGSINDNENGEDINTCEICAREISTFSQKILFKIAVFWSLCLWGKTSGECCCLNTCLFVVLLSNAREGGGGEESQITAKGVTLHGKRSPD